MDPQSGRFGSTVWCHSLIHSLDAQLGLTSGLTGGVSSNENPLNPKSKTWVYNWVQTMRVEGWCCDISKKISNDFYPSTVDFDNMVKLSHCFQILGKLSTATSIKVLKTWV